jgi:hypothetical protein
MIQYSTADYAHMRRVREHAFIRIVGRLGPAHAITKMLGPLAWGRYDAAPSPGNEGRLRAEVAAKAFLDGYFAAINLWARDHDAKAQRVLIDEYPRGYSTAREKVLPTSASTTKISST